MEKRNAILAVLAAALLFSACEKFYRQAVRPRPWGMGKAEGSPIYNQGWDDGCTTGMSVKGYDRYKWSYQFKQDVTLVSNPDYYRAWRDAYVYCRYYTARWSKPF